MKKILRQIALIPYRIGIVLAFICVSPFLLSALIDNYAEWASDKIREGDSK